MTQLDSIKHFIDVVKCQTDISQLASKESVRSHPFVVCKRDLYKLDVEEFFVILANKAIKCDSLIAAIDLAFKSFYVFNISFPDSCYGAWQFIDCYLFEMKQKKSVCSSVKAIAAFVSV